MTSVRVTQGFPRTELHGLTSQLRRACVSVPSNIAEGKGRHSLKEFIQFLYRARGSLIEIETQLYIAHELRYLEAKIFERVQGEAVELGRILNGLIKNVENKCRAV